MDPRALYGCESIKTNVYSDQMGINLLARFNTLSLSECYTSVVIFWLFCTSVAILWLSFIIIDTHKGLLVLQWC